MECKVARVAPHIRKLSPLSVALLLHTSTFWCFLIDVAKGNETTGDIFHEVDSLGPPRTSRGRQFQKDHFQRRKIAIGYLTLSRTAWADSCNANHMFLYAVFLLCSLFPSLNHEYDQVNELFLAFIRNSSRSDRCCVIYLETSREVARLLEL